MSNEFNNLYEFAEFRFDGRKGKLWRNDELILLSPKASELLNLLLEHKGEFVSKEEIFEKIWADTFVEDGVLTQNIYTLRKAIGQSVIENKTRLGYRITVPVFLKEAEKIDTATRQHGNTAIEPEAKSSETEEKSEQNLPESPRPRVPASALIISLVLTSIGGLSVYRYFFSETIVTGSRLEKIRLQKITDTGDIDFLTLSPDGNFAAYIRGAGSEVGSVFVKDLNGGNETKLNIPNVKRHGSIRFSKDGNFLYLRNRANYLIPAEVMKVSRFGGEAQKIAENVWSQFSFSPDETKMVFARAVPTENRHAIIIKNLENGEEIEILSFASPEEFHLRTSPAWSSDGAQIAGIIVRQGQNFDHIFVYDLKQKETKNLSFKEFSQVENLAFLPQKNVLLVSAGEGKFYQLWEIPVADQTVKRFTNDLSNYLSPVVSADGKKILTTQFSFHTNLWLLENENPNADKQLTFSNSNRDGFYGINYLPNGEIVYSSNEGESGATNIWRINPTNNERRKLTDNAGKRNENPCVSPDGNSIYFASNRNGNLAIWQIEADGANPKQITSSENGFDAFPQISPDGAQLYFIRRTGKTSAVFRKILAENREEQLTDAEKFAPTNFLALSPDGKFLGFHNLTDKIQSSDTKQLHQVAVIEIANPNNVKIYNHGGRIPRIFWTTDSTAFDYIKPSFGQDEMLRQSIIGDKPPQSLRKFPKEELYFLSHSPDGKHIAVARGKRQNDAVLLTNFE